MKLVVGGFEVAFSRTDLARTASATLPGKDTQMVMGNSSNDGIQPQMVHVHVCIHCGHPRIREDIENSEITSGVLRFPKCGFDPLNAEFLESEIP